MKKTKFFMCAVLVMAAACILVFSGCPQDAGPEPDPALIGFWTNQVEGLHAGLVKKFTIEGNFTFEASINPTFIGAYNDAYKKAYDAAITAEQTQEAADTAGKTAGEAALTGLGQGNITDLATRWTVTGKLTAEDGGLYLMSNLTETTNKQIPSKIPSDPPVDANTVLAGFNGHSVKITFTKDDKTAFKFESAGTGETADQVTAFFGGDYTKVTTGN